MSKPILRRTITGHLRQVKTPRKVSWPAGVHRASVGVWDDFTYKPTNNADNEHVEIRHSKQILKP